MNALKEVIMLQDTLISIIIPVYNSEEYLEELISLLLKIVNDKVQVIIVDDCSTDNSKAILSKYNGAFKIISLRKNHGVSYARNIGIKYSKGKYITFIDSDDMVSINYLDILISKINENYDLYVFEMDFIYKDRIQNNTTPFNGYIAREELLRSNFLIPQVINWVTNKLFKRHILIDNSIKFNTKNVVGEDLDFMLKVLNSINDIYFINECLYYYNRMNLKSLTRTNLLNLPRDIHLNNQKIKNFFLKNKLDLKNYIIYRQNMYNYVDKQIKEKIEDKKLMDKAICENNRLNIGGKNEEY